MKYLNKYGGVTKLNKLFESDEDDEDDYIPKGYKYSNNYIKDRINYLIDEGFEYDENSKKSYLLDKDGERGDYRLKLDDAYGTSIEFSMFKPINNDDIDYRRVDRGGYPSRSDVYYYTKYSDTINHINEAIASFCEHFDNCLYSLLLEKDGWRVRFIIKSEVDVNIRKEAYSKKRSEEADNLISRELATFRNRVIDRTPAFKKSAFKTKLGESLQNYLGSRESGFMLLPINTTGLSKQVINRNMSDISRINARFYLTKLKKSEIRKITKKDLERVLSDYNKYSTFRGQYDLKYLLDRYLDLDAYVIEYDYKAWKKFLMR